MTAPTPTPPNATANDGEVVLTGDWTLGHAQTVIGQLAQLPRNVRGIDATRVQAMDTLGVLQVLRHARRAKLDATAVRFRPDHQHLVSAIEEVAADRPRGKRDLGFQAALGRLGFAVAGHTREILALVSFFGETLVKLWRTLLQPRRLRLTSMVHHMEQVGLDAVPLVLLLTFMVGAVIAFLGANVLQDFGATIFVVELVNIAFLREFGVLLTAILLGGRTASAFTAQIGAMVNREEVDAIRTLGLDPIDLLVIPRVLALLLMLPLLTFLAMVSGLLGGMVVGATSLDIPMQAYYARMADTIDIQDFWVGMSKTPLFALVIGLIGCLEGLQVEGTAQSVGERTTSSVVQTISLVIVLDALAAIWFMYMGW